MPADAPEQVDAPNRPTTLLLTLLLTLHPSPASPTLALPIMASMQSRHACPPMPRPGRSGLSAPSDSPFAAWAGTLAVRAARTTAALLSTRHPFQPDQPTDEDRRACADKPLDPTISVVVTNFNYQHWISHALDSLLAQTSPPAEIIVVDDGSTDGSIHCVRNYATLHSHITLVQHPGGVNRGLPASLRHGIETASGDYVAFCEADDTWTPGHLEEKRRLLRSFRDPVWIANDVDLFGNPWRCVRMELGNARRIRRRCRQTINTFSPQEFRRANWVLSFSCCMVKRSVLLSLDFTGNPWPEHTDWWLWRQLAAQYPLFYVNRKLTRWRMHQSYVTQARPTPELWNRFRLEMDRLLARQHPTTCGSLLNSPRGLMRRYF